MIKINEDFKRLIPALTQEEYKQLEDNILKEGIREKILTWNGFIIDGHNRYEISQRWDIDFETESKHFDSEDDVYLWMIDNQNGRRNLTDGWKYKLQQRKKEILANKGKEEKSKAGGNKKSLLSIVDKSDIKSENERHNTRKEIAKTLNWSTGKVAMADIVFKKASPEVEEKVLNNEITINQAYKEIKKEEKKANFEQKKAEFEKPIEIINENQIIIQGDSIQILPKLEKKTFDLLLSDPPYGMDFKSGWNNKEKIANDKIQDTTILFENVLKESVPLLKDDAHFYLFGNINFIGKIRPIIEKYLNLKNILIWDRRVIGMGDLKSYGNSYDIIYFGYNKVWKDLNGTRDRDLLSYSRIDPAKNIHPTEKPLDILEYLIKKSSNENDKVLEPFAGGGSTLVACKNTNRQATGIEIEEQYVKLINTRI
jgi:site-specific DNA-methyltransferase (adenine-specific)